MVKSKYKISLWTRWRNKLKNSPLYLHWIFDIYLQKLKDNLWVIICWLGAFLSFYQILISGNVAEGLINIFNLNWLDIFKNISIGYLSGFFLWLFSSYLPIKNRHNLIRRKMKKELNIIYKEIWHLINKYSLDGKKIYWRPLIWLSVKYPNLKNPLPFILQRTNCINVVQELNESDISEKWVELKLYYNGIFSLKEERLIEYCSNSIRKLSKPLNHTLQRENLANFIFNLYQLKSRE